MGIQDEISKKLQEGYTPQQVIDMGYKKSTVYKVYSSIKAYIIPFEKPEWVIQNISPATIRCLPGSKASMSFTFRNNSAKDMYLYQIGIRPEWMESETWFAQEVRDLIRPNQKRLFSFIIQVPGNLPLGEYTLVFGANIQYLPIETSTNPTMQVQWSEPIVLHMKHPLGGTRVFLSHSTNDMQIVRELKNRLDNHGVEAIIAEDIPEPGVDLEEKMESKIRSSTIFLAILTEDSVRSEWVIKETEYARSIGKPCILLKEESLSLQSNIEWTKFSKHDSPDILFSKVMQAINAVQKAIVSPIGAILGIGLLVFLGALILGGSE